MENKTLNKEQINEIKQMADNIISNIGKVIIGKEEVVRLMLTAALAGGHVILEDNPGTGKTMLAKAFAKSVGGDFKRVSFTPDLMPSDITGLNVYNPKQGDFTLVKGPVFTNIFLADEINRATPRTQSSLLEAMEEKQVTIDGVTYKLPEPFFVIATENPIETIGTYPLPEAQLDRFSMKLSMGETSKGEELNIIDTYILENPLEELLMVCSFEQFNQLKNQIKSVFVHPCVREYIVDIVRLTRQKYKATGGISTRGTLCLLRCAQSFAAISGKSYVDPETVKYVAKYVLAHRINQNQRSKGNEKAIDEILNEVEVPVEKWEN